MADLILFVMASVGLTSIITTSTIMEPFRAWVLDRFPAPYNSGIECSQCVGFWAGMLACVVVEPRVFFQVAQLVSILAIVLGCYAYRLEIAPFLGIAAIVGWAGFALFNPVVAGHEIAYGCAGSMASVLFVNVLTWLDAQSLVDIGGDDQ